MLVWDERECLARCSGAARRERGGRVHIRRASPTPARLAYICVPRLYLRASPLTMTCFHLHAAPRWHEPSWYLRHTSSGISPSACNPVPAGRFFCQSGLRDAASLDSAVGMICAHLQSAPRVHCERQRRYERIRGHPVAATGGFTRRPTGRGASAPCLSRSRSRALSARCSLWPSIARAPRPSAR